MGADDDKFLCRFLCKVQRNHSKKILMFECVFSLYPFVVAVYSHCPLVRCLCSSIKVVPVGMSKGVKKLMQERFPNMNKFDDISELLLK